MDQSTFSDMSIYPNPSRNHINIKTLETYDIEIINASGKIIQNINKMNQSHQINLTESGVYFIRFIGENQTHVETVIML